MRGDVPERVPPPDRQHHFDLLAQFLRSRPVALVHHVDVGDLHDSRLEGLDAIARLGHEHQDRRLGAARDVELGLTHADRLHEDALEPERLEQIGHLLRRGCEATVCAAGRHRTDEHVRVEAGGLHPDAVTQQRPAGERAGRIHGYHPHRQPAPPEVPDEVLGQRALAGAGGAGDPDAPGAAVAQARVRVRQHPLEPVALVLDQADRTRQRRGLPPVQPLEDAVNHDPS